MARAIDITAWQSVDAICLCCQTHGACVKVTGLQPLLTTVSAKEATGSACKTLSLVRPYLDYASAIWSPHVNKDKVAPENVQKFACYMATKSWDSGYKDLLDLVDLLSLECRRLETRLCLLYKIIHKLLL